MQDGGGEFHFEQPPPAQPGEGIRFYLSPKNATGWRAIPVMASDLADLVRKEADKHEGTPYSLFSYLFSAPPGRSFAWTQSGQAQAACHCATLSARVLRNASSDVRLPFSSAWYSPSTLFIEMRKRSRLETM